MRQREAIHRLRMFPGMTPASQHRFLHTGSKTLLELTFRSERKPLKQRLRAMVRSLLIGGGQTPPHRTVDREAFASAYDLFSQNPAGAVDRFKALGYDVTVTQLRTSP